MAALCCSESEGPDSSSSVSDSGFVAGTGTGIWLAVYSNLVRKDFLRRWESPQTRTHSDESDSLDSLGELVREVISWIGDGEKKQRER